MSYLAANSFDNSFTTIDIGMRITRSVMIKAIRVKMLKHGTIADGTLTLEVLTDDGTSLSSKSITAAQFNEVNATYAHGYFKFEFDEQVCINLLDSDTFIPIVIRLTMSGHTEDTDNYVALVRQFDGEFVEEYGDRPASTTPEDDGWFNPYGIEIYGIKR